MKSRFVTSFPVLTSNLCTGNAGGHPIYRGVFAERPVKMNEALPTEGEVRQRFLSKIHHELRTPLKPIIGFAEMSPEDVEGRLRDRHRSYFGDIGHAARTCWARSK